MVSGLIMFDVCSEEGNGGGGVGVGDVGDGDVVRVGGEGYMVGYGELIIELLEKGGHWCGSRGRGVL